MKFLVIYRRLTRPRQRRTDWKSSGWRSRRVRRILRHCRRILRRIASRTAGLSSDDRRASWLTPMSPTASVSKLDCKLDVELSKRIASRSSTHTHSRSANVLRIFLNRFRSESRLSSLEKNVKRILGSGDSSDQALQTAVPLGFPAVTEARLSNRVVSCG